MKIEPYSTSYACYLTTVFNKPNMYWAVNVLKSFINNDKVIKIGFVEDDKYINKKEHILTGQDLANINQNSEIECGTYFVKDQSYKEIITMVKKCVNPTNRQIETYEVQYVE